MNISRCILAVLFTLTGTGLAQPPDRPDPMSQEHGRRSDWPPPQGFQPVSPLHKMMQELRTQNPDTFNRLDALRMSDPEAFRQESRTLLHEAVLKRLKEARPEIYTAINQLSPDDRGWLLDAVIKPGVMEWQGKRQKKQPKDHVKGERKNLKKLVKQYYDDSTDENRKKIEADIREILAQQYDQHLKNRQAQLADMEAKLEQARLTLETGEQYKTAFIEEKLSLILHEPLPPGPPE